MSIFKKAGKRVKDYMKNKIDICKEVFGDRENRLTLGIIMFSVGIGLVISAYIPAPTY